MSARMLAAALGGQWRGAYGTARCPAHDDRSPSLSIRDGERGLLIRCHAGCEARDVVAALRARGLWGGRPETSTPCARPASAIPMHASADDRRAIGCALAVLRGCQPGAGTPVETYLRDARGLLTGPVPEVLCSARALRHPSGAHLPAMVAPVQQVDGTVTGCHRTWLRPAGAGKADLSPQKAMLGRCAGGAVRLSPAGDTLQVCEGIETAIAILSATEAPTWAALSTSGIRALILPPEVRHVVICADGDPAGEAAAQAAAQRWLVEGRSVRIARPPRGLDFADVMTSRTFAVTRDAAA